MFGYTIVKEEGIVHLEAKIAELEAINESLKIALSKEREKLPFKEVAKKTEFGGQMYERIVNNFYRELKPTLHENLFNVIKHVLDSAPIEEVSHSEADIDLSDIKLSSHLIEIPAISCHVTVATEKYSKEKPWELLKYV